jgi:hypothetical protein
MKRCHASAKAVQAPVPKPRTAFGIDRYSILKT